MQQSFVLRGSSPDAAFSFLSGGRRGPDGAQSAGIRALQGRAKNALTASRARFTRRSACRSPTR
jgi:hypothetical protein